MILCNFNHCKKQIKGQPVEGSQMWYSNVIDNIEIADACSDFKKNVTQ